ncbi:TIGR03761 family integrating conjugative element protein, partial [Salmonella enterica]|nr:TIGR03761 family integrating conjugative element protein [Salmonella enterica]
ARNAGPESISAPDAPSESRLPVDPQTGSDSLTC